MEFDAVYFRKRAQQARRMATQGDDPGLTMMLLDLATEMEAEAVLIENEVMPASRQSAGAVSPVHARECAAELGFGAS